MKNIIKSTVVIAVAGMLAFAAPVSASAASWYGRPSETNTTTRVVRRGNATSRQTVKQRVRQPVVVRGRNNVISNTSVNNVYNTQQTVNNYSNTPNGTRDGNGNSGSASVVYSTRTNSSYNPAPVFISGPVRNARVGIEYRYAAVAYDRNGDVVYSLVEAPAGMRINSDSALITWTPTAAQANRSYTVTVMADDGYNDPIYQKFEVSVQGNGTITTTNSNSNQGSTVSTGNGSSQVAANSVVAGGLTISNVFISSTRNINQPSVAGANCSVTVSWTTNVPSAGQVVYGTVSQPNANRFAYEFAAPERGSLDTNHSVVLGCLSSEIYFFRISAFGTNSRAVSQEMTLFPLNLTSGESVSARAVSAGTASALETIGVFFTNPFVLILIVLVIAYIIFRKSRRSGGADHGHADAHAEEPVINIPHH